MKLWFKVYAYKSGFQAFYLTLNEIQFGPVHFSERAVMESIEKLKRGEKL